MKTTHRTTGLLLITMIAVLIMMPFIASAQGVPGAINYQGRLLDSGGAPITTTVTLNFTLWDAPTSGTRLLGWKDNDDILPDANGIYSTEIGDDPDNPVPTSILSSSPVWLQVSVFPVGPGAGETLSPRSRLLSVPYALSANTLNGESYITVATSSDPGLNGFYLKEAYNAAKALTPHGAMLSATNRATVIVPPGNYDLGTSALILDTEFVDLIGLSSARENQYIFGLSGGTNTGVLMQSANNVRIENLFIECTKASGGATGLDTDPAAYFPDDAATTDTVIRNCEFKAILFEAWSMRIKITYPGRFEDCTGGISSFGGHGGIASGTFTNCTGGSFSFGGLDGIASGIFLNCSAGSFSFGSDTASGTFTNCSSTSNSFGGGNGSTASGTFINCTSPGQSFGGGGTASGNFTNCVGGNSSFGGSVNTFGGLFIGTASGTFTNCTGGDGSFGGGTGGSTVGGKFYFCKSGPNSLPPGGLRRFCDVDGGAVND